MFSQMVSELKNGTLPENNLLRKRFEAALIKKIGVIRTPYSFWPADEKINPPAKQLLWAAILLHDLENFEVVKAIISSELEEKQKAKGQPESIQTLAAKVQLALLAYVSEFIDLGPSETFREILRHRTEDVFPSHRDMQPCINNT